MQLLRLITGVVLLLTAVVAGALFSLQNTTPVAIDLLLVQLPERTLGLWLLLSLMLGTLLGMSAGAVMLLSARAKLIALQRQKQRLALEVDRLRKVGLTEGE